MSAARILRCCSVSGRCVVSAPPHRWCHGGGVGSLPGGVREFVEESTRLCQPSRVHVCTGSTQEADTLLGQLETSGQLTRLTKLPNCWLARTDPRDVARVESRTVMVTDCERDSVPLPSDGSPSQLGRWMSPLEFQTQVGRRFPGCMRGRTMYVLPFSMGPLGSPLARLGVQLTDSPYVVVSMGIMTRMGSTAMNALTPPTAEFTRCLHSVGRPLTHTGGVDPEVWPCDPARTLIGHVPARREIVSFGSGYGGNSLLGKKCLALRIASGLARDQGWLAEHMLILGVTSPAGVKTYVAAAFPSACGKTNMAMMCPQLPGWTVECVGDDIAWMHFDSNGQLRAINPENGFFGVAPGTSQRTNPNAMATIARNTVFTNVGATSDGGVYWEGIEQEIPPGVTLTSWTGDPWAPGDSKPCAHPNSRFCAPARQCPSMDPAWESPEGVPIDAIIFGGRRPEGVPLVYEAFDWAHGVFVGAAMRSESTAAAEHKGKQLMHDPFAMRPFLGYNFGHYLRHWLELGVGRGLTHGRAPLPRIFHVNWFRRGPDGGFLWPGFGHNVRVLEWICGRVQGQAQAQARASAIGLLPAPGSINLQGLAGVDMDALLSLPKDFWQKEAAEVAEYLRVQVNQDLPPAIAEQAAALQRRVEEM